MYDLPFMFRVSGVFLTYNKLIRAHTPDIIQSAGKNCTTEVLSDEDYFCMIDVKLDEELAEYHESKHS